MTTHNINVDGITNEIIEFGETIVDGWYAVGRVDWEDVWDRMDGRSLSNGDVLDLGNDLGSEGLVKLKAAIMRARKSDLNPRRTQ